MPPFSLKDLYSGKLYGKPWTMPQVTNQTRNLPYGAGTYSPLNGLQPTPTPTPPVTPAPQSPGLFIGPQNKPVTPAPLVGSFGGTAALPQKYDYNAGVVTPAQTGSYTPPAGDLTGIPPKFINPKTGALYSVQEFVDNVANTMPQGDIPQYAGDILTQGPQTKEQLFATAGGLSATRGDIASGTTDPYKVATKSGINYSPSELAAIEKAYAGIYDPAINTALAKLDTKKKEEEAAIANKMELERMAKQHEYAMAEKGLTTSGTSLTGEYVKGANPAVDAWAQRIFDGNAKITDIPASQKGMRDAVTIALTASGNDLTGRPTVTELGKAAKTEAESIMADFKARKGTSAVGASRFWGAGGLWAAMPGTPAFDFKNSVTNLVSQLSLEGVKYLKGQGAVSDAERALLSNAVTKLKLSQSEGEFQETLQGIIDRLSGTGSGKLTSPDGTQEVNKSDLTPEQLKEAADAGWY